jgi:CTP:molybdopterin cytidylyltransferase MocA
MHRQERVGVVILEGGRPVDLVERQMVGIRQAMTLDTIAKLQTVPEIDDIYLSTNYPDLATEAARLGAIVVPEEEPWHFGTCLQHVIRQADLDGVIYIGGASCPLLTTDEFRSIASDLRSRKRLVLTNNPQSSDIVAFTPAAAIDHIQLPDNDNVLANLLRNQAGLERVFLPHSVGVHYDIDTPSDVLVLSLSPKVGPRTRQALDQLDWDRSRVQQALRLLASPQSRLLLAGRVNPWTMSHIGMISRCRLRVISEERGMRAMGRAERGEVHSLFGFLLQQLGAQAMVDYICSIADMAFIDTRVVFAHLGLQLTEGQRFNSDLGRVEQLPDQLMADFVRACHAAPVPIILGGHSLVAGSMWALMDALLYLRGEEQLPAQYQLVQIDRDHPWVGQPHHRLILAGRVPGELLAYRQAGLLNNHPRSDFLVSPGMKLYYRIPTSLSAH